MRVFHCALASHVRAGSDSMIRRRYKVRYARRVDPWPQAIYWICGVPRCKHKFWFFAWLHAVIRRPWLLRVLRER